MEWNHMNVSLVAMVICLFTFVVDDARGYTLNKQSERSRHIRSVSDIQDARLQDSKTSFNDNYFGTDPDHQKLYQEQLDTMLTDPEKRGHAHQRHLSLKNLISLIHETSNRIRKLSKTPQPDMDDDQNVRIKTVVKTWSKNDPENGRDNVISGYKTEVGNPKRAGRLSINGALSSLADLLVSENQRRDRMESMELRQRLQYLG